MHTPLPTSTPTLRDDSSIADTRRMERVEMVVPFSYTVDIVGNHTTLDTVRERWEDYLQTTLLERFPDSNVVQVVDVVLELQPSSTTTTNVRGEAILEIDDTVVDWVVLSHQVQTVLHAATTADQLQAAVMDDNVRVMPPTTTAAALKRPSTARIVVGFTLLALTLASLGYWARFFWLRRKKYLRRKYLESLRQSQSVTAFARPKPPLTAVATQSPPEMGAVTAAVEESNSVDSRAPTSIGNTEETDTSDPFGAELQRAVSMDRVTWNEFQKQREVIAQQQRAQQEDPVVVDFSGDAGIEVLAGLNTSRNMSTHSYPYGDERMSDTFLNESDTTTIPGLSPNRTSSLKSPFSPYGDGKPSDFDHKPSDDKPLMRPSTFPPSTRPVSTTEPIMKLDPGAYSDSTTSQARHDSSIEVTTLESPLSRSTDENIPTESDDEHPHVESATESMLREVQSVASFLRQYEQKKQKTPERHRRRRIDPSLLSTHDTNAQTSLAPVFSRSGTRTALRAAAAHRTILTEIPLDDRTRQPGVSPQEQGRLGIGQFSLGSPLSQMESYKLKPSPAGGLRRFQPDVDEGEERSISTVPSEDPLEFTATGGDVAEDPLEFTATGGDVDDEPFPEFPPTDPNFVTVDDGPNMSTEDSHHSRLSSLRTGESILDTVPSSEVPDSDVAGATSTHDRTQIGAWQDMDEQQNSVGSSVRRKRVSPRSTNLMFNNIRSIFEEKFTDPIVPPSDTVR